MERDFDYEEDIMPVLRERGFSELTKACDDDVFLFWRLKLHVEIAFYESGQFNLVSSFVGKSIRMSPDIIIAVYQKFRFKNEPDYWPTDTRSFRDVVRRIEALEGNTLDPDAYAAAKNVCDFLVCHECGHRDLNHTKSNRVSELEADAFAVDQIVKHRVVSPSFLRDIGFLLSVAPDATKEYPTNNERFEGIERRLRSLLPSIIPNILT